MESKRAVSRARTIGDTLSPSSNQDQRRAGRHGLQVVADTLSFGQNLPLRLLLWDRLHDLPTVLHNLLQRSDAKDVIRQSAICADIDAESAFRALQKLDIPTISLALDRVADLMEALADDTKAELELSPLASEVPSSVQPAYWWQVLLVL